MVNKWLNIIWDNEAKKALRNIYNYIKGRELIDIAKKVRNEIFSQTQSQNSVILLKKKKQSQLLF